MEIMEKSSQYSLNSEQAYYERLWIWGENHWSEAQVERSRETVSMLPNDVKCVLDVGCGAGIVMNELVRRFPLVVGADFVFEPLKQVQSFQIQASADFLPFPGHSFDAVVATELIEHLPERMRSQALQEMPRLTKKYILITVPHREVLEMNQAKCAECGCIFHKHRHTMGFDKQQMSKLFIAHFVLENINLMGRRTKLLPRVLVKLYQAFDGYGKVQPGVCLQIVGRWSTEYPDEPLNHTPFHQEEPHGP
jgi:SAM-dependent methyltransferase